MHVYVLNVVLIWLFIVVSTESSESFVTKIGLHWIYTSYQHVYSTVELLLVYYQWVVDVPLDQVLLMESCFR